MRHPTVLLGFSLGFVVHWRSGELPLVSSLRSQEEVSSVSAFNIYLASSSDGEAACLAKRPRLKGVHTKS
eukprot:1802122-Amphidinium_carterae.1